MAEKTLTSSIRGSEALVPSVSHHNELRQETQGKISREKEADLALKSTLFTPGARLLVALFLLTLAAVPILQLAVEVGTPRASGSLPMFDDLKTLPGWAKIGTA